MPSRCWACSSSSGVGGAGLCARRSQRSASLRRCEPACATCASPQRGGAEWVRGRALSISTLTLYGSLAIGALLWGTVASRAGTQWALTGAGIALLLGLGLIPRFRLAAAEAGNLEHSQNWPDPVVA